MKTVLAPIDFSPISQRVVDESVALARAIGARLVLFHATAAPMAPSAEIEADGDYFPRIKKHAVAKLTGWQQRLRDEGVTAHAVHRVGAAGPQIAEQAERLEADYIVMGSHGHGAFYDLLMGSTTTRVLKVVKCGVVIVPAEANVSSRRKTARRRAASGAAKPGGVGQEMRSSSQLMRRVAASF